MAETKTEILGRPVQTPEATSGDLATTERDLEIAGTDDDILESFIGVADRLEKYAAEQDKILAIVIKRTFAGDWVSHDRQDVPIEQRKANISGAGAERIARFLGIQERNWVEHPKEWFLDNKHYRYKFSADFTFRKITRRAIGMASTQDKFFGFSHGTWRPLEDIKEDDIRIAAFNETVKRGIVRVLGLRNIPILKLKELGYDTNLIQYAEFMATGKQIKKDELKTGEGNVVWRDIQVANVQKFEGVAKATGKPWIRWDVYDKENIKYALFAPAESKRVALLQERQEDQMPVKIGFKVVQYNKQDNYQIEKVEGAEE